MIDVLLWVDMVLVVIALIAISISIIKDRFAKGEEIVLFPEEVIYKKNVGEDDTTFSINESTGWYFTPEEYAAYRKRVLSKDLP